MTEVCPVEQGGVLLAAANAVGWAYFALNRTRRVFMGNTLRIVNDGAGVLVLEQHDDELYFIRFPMIELSGLLSGNVRAEVLGQCSVECSKTKHRIDLKFHKTKATFRSQKPSVLRGTIRVTGEVRRCVRREGTSASFPGASPCQEQSSSWASLRPERKHLSVRIQVKVGGQTAGKLEGRWGEPTKFYKQAPRFKLRAGETARIYYKHVTYASHLCFFSAP